MADRLRFPEDVRQRLRRRFMNQRTNWLAGAGQWPLCINLGQPIEADALERMDALRDWVQAWLRFEGPGEVQWQERRWPKLGQQRLPSRLLIASPTQAAAWIGELPRWSRALQRIGQLADRNKTLIAPLARHYDMLADYSDCDFERLTAVLGWLEEHPRSNLMPRQLPIPGLDSKWLENRQGLIAQLLGALHDGDANGADFFQCCGLRPPPRLVRIRILDADLRARAGGLCDLTTPVDELKNLDLPAQCVFIVENTQTGLAFGDIKDAVVIMGLGYCLDVLRDIPWICRSRIVYWGDIDTHGFAILNRARIHLPQAQSLMMDVGILLQHRDLCVEEGQQHGAGTLPNLKAKELEVYHGLKQQQWGYSLRLEQERISWTKAWPEILKAHRLQLQAQDTTAVSLTDHTAF